MCQSRGDSTLLDEECLSVLGEAAVPSPSGSLGATRLERGAWEADKAAFDPANNVSVMCTVHGSQRQTLRGISASAAGPDVLPQQSANRCIVKLRSSAKPNETRTELRLRLLLRQTPVERRRGHT